jgi:hypothetical protein
MTGALDARAAAMPRDVLPETPFIDQSGSFFDNPQAFS